MQVTRVAFFLAILFNLAINGLALLHVTKTLETTGDSFSSRCSSHDRLAGRDFCRLSHGRSDGRDLSRTIRTPVLASAAAARRKPIGKGGAAQDGDARDGATREGHDQPARRLSEPQILRTGQRTLNRHCAGLPPRKGVEARRSCQRNGARSPKPSKPRQQCADVLLQLFEDGIERVVDFSVRPSRERRISEAPMRRRRSPGPDRAGLGGSVVTNCDDRIDLGRAGPCELVPVLRPRSGCIQPVAFQNRDGLRVHRASGLGAGGKRAKPGAAVAVQDCLGQNGTGRIAGTQEKHVGRVCPSADPPAQALSPPQHEAQRKSSALRRGPSRIADPEH